MSKKNTNTNIFGLINIFGVTKKGKYKYKHEYSHFYSQIRIQIQIFVTHCVKLTLRGSVTDGATPPGFDSSNPRTKVEPNSAVHV